MTTSDRVRSIFVAIGFTIAGSAAFAQPAFTPTIITTGVSQAHSVFAADIDGDGDADLLSAGLTDTAIRWYENDGGATPSFTARVVFDGVDRGYSVFAADIDGDGDMDVLSASQTDNAVRWYENDGAPDPSFTPHDITLLALGASWVYATDLDGDGDTDVLSSSNGDNTTRWYENDGASDPSFTTRDIFTAAPNTRCVFAGDMDGDGDVDVVSSGAGNSRIYWHENDGASPPSFTTIEVSNQALNPWGVFVTDLDSDGALDILSASETDDDITWFQSDGAADPSFSQAVIFGAADFARAVFANDLDGDGDIDVLSGSLSDNSIRWHENDGGITPNFTTRTVSSTALSVRSVFAADIDGDFDVDIVSASEGDNSIRVFYNDTHTEPVRNFSIGAEYADLDTALAGASAGNAILAARTAFDAVLSLDLAGLAAEGVLLFSRTGITQPSDAVWSIKDFNVISSISPLPTVQLGAETVRLGAPADLILNGHVDVTTGFPNLQGGPIHLTPTGILTAPPFGGVDLFTVEPAEESAVLLEGSVGLAAGAELNHYSTSPMTIAGALDMGEDAEIFAQGSIELALPADLLPGLIPNDITLSAFGATSVFAADVDGDGDIDALSASLFDDAVRWHENDGMTPPSFTTRTITLSADAARSVFAADVDGDGDTDVLSASGSDDTIRWYENDGTTPPSFTTRVITASADEALSVFAADLDADGDTDVLSASSADNTIRWYENDGMTPPSFTTRVITASADAARSVFAADVDGDGDTDVLSASAGDDTIRWYENDGMTTPSFTTRVITTTANSASSVSAADIDGDGDTDVLSGSNSSSSNSLLWYENDGATPPSFTTRIISGSNSRDSVFAADVDGDGDTDVLSASQFDNTVWLYEHDGMTSPSFTERVIDASAIGARSVFAADVDGDGDTDVLSASLADNAIRWYESITTDIGSGARFISQDAITNSGQLDLPTLGLIDAPLGFTNTGSLVSRFGNVNADMINAVGGDFTVDGSTQVVGDLTNDGAITLAGSLAVTGTITNNGVIEDGPARGGNASLFSDAGVTLGQGATLTLGASGGVRTGGDYDNAINDTARFDMAASTLHLDGAAQTLEVMSTDIGPDPAGLNGAMAGHYPLGALRIGPGSTVATLIDTHDNDGLGQAACEAIYVSMLTIEAGATLNTGACVIYYESLSNSGSVDNPANLIELSAACPADLNGDMIIDTADLGILIGAFGSASEDADINGDGVVDTADLGILIGAFGSTCG